MMKESKTELEQNIDEIIEKARKVSNTFIENAISRSNLSALKTLYYLSTVLSEKELEKIE